MPDQKMRAAIYCRLSLAKFGDTTKVEDQERICRDLCARRGWDVFGVYADNNQSAWQRSRKRPAWDRMLADVGDGKISAIVVYHGDRLVRQPFDLETLLNLAYGRGIRLASPTGERDLSSEDDLFILRIEVAAQCRESASISRRKKAQHERMRRAGLVRSGGRGGRAFGFTTDGVTQVPAEAELIRSAAGRILGGEPTGQVARWLNAQGAITPAGGPFDHSTVRKMLGRPRLAGLMPDGESRAAWDPVLDRAEWESVRRVLAGRAAGFGYATNARKHLLSGIATCGAPGCGSPLQLRAETRPGMSGYGCVKPGCRKVQRSARLLDAYVAAAVVGRLALEANPAGIIPEAPGLAAEFAALSGQRAEIEEAMKDHAQGRLSLLLARLDSLDARLAQLRQLAGDDAHARLRRDHAGITEGEFDALPLQVRRSLVMACLEIVILPASKRGPGLRLEDLRVTPR